MIFMSRKIIIGEIRTKAVHVFKTPIECFNVALELSKRKNFLLQSNNPQLIEALEVLCGEENISIYLKLGGKCKEISFLDAYNYLGDIYDIIDYIRICKTLDNSVDKEFIKEDIEDYIKKYEKMVGIEDT